MNTAKTGLAEGGAVQDGETVVILQQSSQGEGWAEVGPMEGEQQTPGNKKKVQQRELNLTAQCLICSGPAAAHQHYGAVCCYSCRAFFRRGITRSYACVRGDDLCQVNSITRTNCKRCRYARCLVVGMKPELVDATLKRKQEEKRRQEQVEIQQELGIQVENRAPHPPRNGVQQLLQAQQVLAAVQGIQHPHSEVDPLEATEAGERPDDSIIYQALEGKKKVLLELRNTESPRQPIKQQQMVHHVVQEHQMQQQMVQQQPIQQQTFLHIEESPRAPSSGPLRQQTYYIFHPATQTFEPITIAEFEENAVIEEVVVAEDYSLEREEDEEHIITVINEHDYVEVPPEGGFAMVSKRPRLEEQDMQYVEEEIQEKKYIPPIQVTNTTPVVKQEAGQVSVIRRLTPPVFTSSITPGCGLNSSLSKVIEETIGGDMRRSLSEEEAVTEILPISVSNHNNGPIAEQEVNNYEEVEEQHAVESHQEEQIEHVDIEKLVDVCFEEELQKPLYIPINTLKEVPQNEQRPKVIQRVKRRPSEKRTRQSGSPLPLKKRRKVHHYPIAMAIDRLKVPHICFTIEEEFRVHDLKARSEHIQVMMYKEYVKVIPDIWKKMLMNFVVAKKNNKKVRQDSEEDMDKLNDLSRQLYATKFMDIFDEFQSMEKKTAFRLLFTNWPSLSAAQLIVGEANVDKGCRGQMQCMGIPEEICNQWHQMVPELKEFLESDNTPGCALSDFVMFVSPWAQSQEDEVFFEKTVNDLGKILGDDQKLSTLYQMLLMVSQPLGSKRPSKQICEIQGDLGQLLYRYLSSKNGRKTASDIAYSLLGFINKLHRCGDILLNRRIRMLD